MKKKIVNLTGHDINIVADKDGMVIPSDGIVRLEIRTQEEHIPGLNLPLVKREVGDLTGDTHLLDGADAVIVSAQAAPYIKEHYPYLTVLTVGETVREKNPDGSVTIRGAKNLVIN